MRNRIECVQFCFGAGDSQVHVNVYRGNRQRVYRKVSSNSIRWMNDATRRMGWDNTVSAMQNFIIAQAQEPIR